MPRKAGYVTRQAERLSAGQINRRRFVASALSAGVTLPTALSLASKAQARVPKPGGHLRMALAGEGAFTRALAFAHGNALTEITATGEVIGDLAETIEPAHDAQTWIVTLRRGIDFHDGQPLSTDDVLATLRRQRPAHVTDIRATGPHQVTFDLARPDDRFARRLADPRLVIRPAGSAPGTANGTGPYRLERLDPGERAELSRNPAYWKPGRAHVETLRLGVTPDATDRQTALMTGEVDYADRIDPRGVALLKRAPTLAILEHPGPRHLALRIRPEIAPFDTPDLRRALAHAIDGTALLDRLLFGHGTAATDAFDPDEAARLYRRSGHSGPVPLAVAPDPLARDAARVIAAGAARAGIEIAPTEATGADGWTVTLAEGAIAPGTLAPLRLHDIAGHTATLAHEGTVATELENDGARLAERWWFT